jgi:hypothetical protein
MDDMQSGVEDVGSSLTDGELGTSKEVTCRGRDETFSRTMQETLSD